MFTLEDKKWMQHAINLAKHAGKMQEVPVGAVLVKNNELIAEGWNQPITQNDPTAHAEIVALRSAASTLRNYRLPDTTLYVTLEPCLMCLGALTHARVRRIVFGALEPRAGAVKSAFQLHEASCLNHKIEYHHGLFSEECSKLLKNFFQCRR